MILDILIDVVEKICTMWTLAFSPTKNANPDFLGIGIQLKFFNGSPGGTRTPDPVVNSHLLYRLSYRGAINKTNASI